MNEDSKVALVTGGSRGIGKAIAERLCADGYTVVGTATSDGGAERISAYLKEAGNGGCGMTLNVSDDDSVAAVIKAIGEQYGAPLVLVNNAGFGTFGKFEELTLARQLAMVRLHIDASVELSRAALPFMRELGGGRIINVASLGAFAALKDSAVYGASKAFLVAFSRPCRRRWVTPISGSSACAPVSSGPRCMTRRGSPISTGTVFPPTFGWTLTPWLRPAWQPWMWSRSW